MHGPTLPVARISPAPAPASAPAAAAAGPAEAESGSFGDVLARGMTQSGMPEPAAEATPPVLRDSAEDADAADTTDAAPPDLAVLALPDGYVLPQPVPLRPELTGSTPPAQPAARSSTRATGVKSGANATGRDTAAASAETAAEPAKSAAGSDAAVRAAADRPQAGQRDRSDAITAAAGAARLDQAAEAHGSWLSARVEPAAGSVATGAARIDVPLHQAGWQGAFAQRVVMLVNGGQQSAELHVNPAELGPIDITLSFDRDQASVVFVSAHASVREAIETALPALREAMQQAGIQLGDTSVTAESFQRQAQQHGQAPARGAATPAGATGAEGAAPAAAPGSGRIGLVDIFA